MSKSLSDCVVEARSLVKRFGAVTALDGLDLSVRTGEIHGFLGPNGAGKSTTIRALLGQLRLSSGTVAVFGQDAWRHAVDIHSRLAYVPGDTMLWPNLTGGQCIDLLGGFHGAMNRARRDELVERFDLDPTRRFRTYSKGNRQKVALVAALACDVELLVLDEPTSGLDPLMEAVFQAVVTERSASGTSVLLSSHILAEVETLCDRLTVVRAGRVTFTGPLSQLRSSAATAVDVVTPAAIPGLEHVTGVSRLRSQAEPRGHRTTLLAQAAALPTVLTTVGAARPLQVTVHPPSLEQLFLDQYTEQETNDGGEPR
ncbi:ABC transporter ATP-binding protein [Actinomyces naeslundii]|uniref:ABC transporter ATP-binding protein n=1 Tax=Actinomyces naeslundii TaxID=1655 RepID=UPI00096FD89B|nr:ABC transporter ATP-binding protein [Actinomyces naeslundii]OMG07192.1 multidrug ABC transporter ATP-binding protein [Actinomyces naeslundii]